MGEVRILKTLSNKKNKKTILTKEKFSYILGTTSFGAFTRVCIAAILLLMLQCVVVEAQTMSKILDEVDKHLKEWRRDPLCEGEKQYLARTLSNTSMYRVSIKYMYATIEGRR